MKDEHSMLAVLRYIIDHDGMVSDSVAANLRKTLMALRNEGWIKAKYETFTDTFYEVTPLGLIQLGPIALSL